MNKKNIKKKLSIKEKKDNTIHSLSEVECFLKNFKSFSNYIKLFKIINNK